jgi:adenylate cyclase
MLDVLREDGAKVVAFDVTFSKPDHVRSFFRLPNEQVVLEYGPVGAYKILFGQSAQVRSDDLGRAVISFHGPGYTYPHYSLADVVEKKISPDAFGGKIVLVGATATGIGDLRTTPYGGLDFPGVEIHANVIDCILHQSFLYRGAKQTLADVRSFSSSVFPWESGWPSFRHAGCGSARS